MLKKYTLHILGLSALKREVFDRPMEQNALIVCEDRKIPFLDDDMVRNRLILDFPDVADNSAPGAFCSMHADRILSFLEHLPDEVTDLYICCAEGMSRSPGIAAALLKISGRSDRDVWRNPYYSPNTLVFRELCREAGIFMPDLFVRFRKAASQRAFRKAQRKGNTGKYERWEILL